jgi:hypothetical protein
LLPFQKQIKVGFKTPQAITLPRGQYKLSQQVIELNADFQAPVLFDAMVSKFFL